MAAEKLITVILPQGRGMAVLQALYERRVLRAALGTARAPFSYMKGRGMIARTVRHWVEKDVLSVVVSAEEAEENFGFLHQLAGIGDAPGGFMLMGPLARASAFSLPPERPSA